jgi:hypothetical protein
MKALSILLMLIGITSSATPTFDEIFVTYKVTPSSAAKTNSNIVFNPNGGDFGITNVVVAGPYFVDYDPPSTDSKNAVTPLYLSFGVAKGVLGSDGIIRYQPDLSRFQIYIVDPKNQVLIQAQPTTIWTVQHFSGSKTAYSCSGPAKYGYNSIVYLTVSFDISLPPGKQVTGGQFFYLQGN